LFFSPPWGGPEYITKEVFSIEELGKFGQQAYNLAKKISPNVAFFLPRNTSVEEVNFKNYLWRFLLNVIYSDSCYC